MSYRNARKYLRDIWLAKSEQDELIHLAEALSTYLKARDSRKRSG